MLLQRTAVERASEILKPDDFYRDAHRFIFEAIMSISQNDEPVEVLTVSEELTSRNKLDNIGGVTYLINLLDAPTTAANVEYYARLVEEKSLLRRIMDAGTQIQGLAYSEFENVEEVVDRAERIVFEVGQRRTGQFFAELRPLLDDELDRIEKRYENKGLTTGRQTPFDDLNHKTSGLQPSDLIIIAARPAMGKTSLAVQLGQYIAMNEKLPVAIFSLEMSKEQLVARMICSEAKVDAHRLRTGMLLTDDWQKVGEAISRLAEAPIFIDDSPDISALEMRAKCRRLKAERNGLGLIMIDYLQLMRGSKKTENRTQEISEIARSCKGLARELKVPVIALSQLSRAVESRPDKRPMLSDLRESGSIEAEADIVMFIYREAYYKQKEAKTAQEQQEEMENRPVDSQGREQIEVAELIIAKHRSGPTGTVKVGFIPYYTRFENLAPDQYGGYGDSTE
ncbi:MAG: replicative DNA helicase [Chthonomonadaceae bacterium]|nr:replicative DNA helicase [Chthonomonadaceae bacterium]